MMWGYGGWGYGFMTLSMVVFWGLAALGVFVLVRHLSSAGRRELDEPERVLADRFARGEIDVHEYHDRLDALRATGSQR